MKQTFKVVIESTPTGLSAYIPKLPGVITTGSNVPEVETNIKEALKLYFSLNFEPQIKLSVPKEYKETVYLLSTKANSEAIKQSINDVKEGKNLVSFDPTAE